MIFKKYFLVVLIIGFLITFLGKESYAQYYPINNNAYNTEHFNQSSSYYDDKFIIQGEGFNHIHEVVIRGNEGVFNTRGSSIDGRTLSIRTPVGLQGGSYEVLVRTEQGNRVFSNVQINPSLQTVVPTHTPSLPSIPVSWPRPCLFGFIFCPQDVQASSTSYVALGDSLAVGSVAIRGYVSRYASHIERDNNIRVEVKNRGVRGLQSAELLAQLQSNQVLRNELSQADIITWSIGGNDLLIARELYQSQRCGGQDNQECLRDTVRDFKQNWDGILHFLMNIRQQSGNSVMMRSMTIYYPQVTEDMSRNSWPNSAVQNDFEVLNFYLQEVNRHIVQTLQSNNIPYAQVARLFNGVNGNEDPNHKLLLSYDRVHPNDLGHSHISRLLQQLGYRELGVSSLQVNRRESLPSL